MLVTGGTENFSSEFQQHIYSCREKLLLLFFFKWSLLVTELEEKQVAMCVLIVSPIAKGRDPECVTVHHDQEHDVMKPTIIYSYCSYGEALTCLI